MVQGPYGTWHQATHPTGSAALPRATVTVTVMGDASPSTASWMLVLLPSSGGTAGRSHHRQGMEPHGEKSESPASFSLVQTRGKMVKLCKMTASTMAWETGCLRGQNRQGVPSLRVRLHGGEWWGLAVSLVRLMRPILIQDAEDIIDLNKLSVKEKL